MNTEDYTGKKEIRAFYTDKFIRFYQAYNNVIADAAVKHNTFLSPPFKMERTTWIKPSFFWMMYRCGWATKENQERVLAVDITHEGFEWILSNYISSTFDRTLFKNDEDWLKAKDDKPVVIQWDPERDMFLNKLDYRSIQIGLKPVAVQLYARDWILAITDITTDVKAIKALLDENKVDEARALCPKEAVYKSLE